MFTVFYVIKSVHIIADNRTSCSIVVKDDLDSAKVKFHDDLRQTIGNAQYDYVLSEILDANGNAVARETWYAPVPEPVEEIAE